jgi:hypothetical protein
MSQAVPPLIDSLKLSTRSASAAAELGRIRQEMMRLLTQLEVLLGSNQFPLLKVCNGSQELKVHKLSMEETGGVDHWFFIGDIHGDFYALHSMIRHAESLDPECRILFLGDIVDRGHLPFECILLLLEWGLRHPGHLAWIAGNHDIAYGKVGQRFISTCSPAETLEDLNRDDTFISVRQKIGDFFVNLVERLPRALLFPEGLLATHGGMPHTDLQKEGAAIEDEDSYLEWLSSEACLKDFTWTRMTRYPKRYPDRHSTGCQYGFKDFEAFCDLKPAFFAPTAIVTGHEHAEGGADTRPTYVKYPALTLLGQGFDDLLNRNSAAFYTQYRDMLRLGRGVPGHAPEVIDVPVDREDLLAVYSEQLAVAGYTSEPKRDVQQEEELQASHSPMIVASESNQAEPLAATPDVSDGEPVPSSSSDQEGLV